MRKTFISMMLAVVAMCGYADNNGQKLHVKVDCKDVGDTLEVFFSATPTVSEKFVGKQGVFDFEIAVPAVSTMTLAEPSLFRGNYDAHYYRIPAIPGEEVILTQEKGSTRYDVTGSKFYAQYHAADLMAEEAQKPMNAVARKYQQMLRSGAPQDSVMEAYNKEVEPLQEACFKTFCDYLKAHADEEASVAIVKELMPDVAKVKAAVQLLSPAVREGRCKPLYQVPIDEQEAQEKAEQEAAKLQAEGREAPDFTLNDLQGKPLKLSSLRGKYVILDFWGSWCVWCIKGFPEMKNYYEKYRGKFEILGIDCNDTEAKWKAAVEKHQLPWLHVYNPKDSKVLEDYGIQGFPTKIIIGPDGRIVKTIVGEDPQFYTLLDSLFQ